MLYLISVKVTIIIYSEKENVSYGKMGMQCMWICV